jgi:hypothetical protein
LTTKPEPEHAFQIETRARIQIGTAEATRPRLRCLFNGLPGLASWSTKCEGVGMSIWVILFSLQVIVTVFALLRESGNDAQFEGDKLDFRS